MENCELDQHRPRDSYVRPVHELGSAHRYCDSPYDARHQVDHPSVRIRQL